MYKVILRKKFLLLNRVVVFLEKEVSLPISPVVGLVINHKGNDETIAEVSYSLDREKAICYVDTFNCYSLSYNAEALVSINTLKSLGWEEVDREGNKL